MHLSYRKLFIVISIVVASQLFTTTSQSCGPDWYHNQLQILLFRQPITGNDNLEPLHFNSEIYSDFHSDPGQHDRKRNCEEWSRFTDNTVPWKDIMEVQYAMPSNDFLEAVHDIPQGSYRHNRFVKWLKQPSNKAALDYMIFAKEIESNAACLDDPWEEEETSFKCRFQPLVDTVKNRCVETLPTFIRQRYIFQGMKLLSYQTFNSDSMRKSDMHLLRQYYEKELLNKNVVVGDWGLLYYGWMTGDSLSQTKAWLQCFAQSDEKKSYMIRLLETRWIKQLLETPIDTALRKTAYTVLNIKNPGKGLQYIRKIVDIDPDDKFLPLMVCREVNKLEDWLLTPELLGFGNSVPQWKKAGFTNPNRQKDLVYLREVRQELEHISSKSRMHKDLLYLAIAHLCQIDQDYATAERWLKRVNTKGRPRYIRQKAIAIVLGTMYAYNTTDPQVQQKIYEQLHLLQSMQEEKNNQELINGPMLQLMPQLYLVLSQQLLKNHDLIKAGMAFQKAQQYEFPVNIYYGFNYNGTGYADTTIGYRHIAWFEKYASPSDIDALIAFKHQSSKTAFEQMINTTEKLDDNILLDVKGTLQVRSRQFEAAAATFAAIPTSYWEYTPFDYYGLTHNIEAAVPLYRIDTTHYADYKVGNKRIIVDHILQLQKARSAAVTLKEKAQAAMQLGNAYFNITYEGKAWSLITYGKSYSESARTIPDGFSYSSWPLTSRFGNDYFDCRESMKLYREAITYAGKDEELKAKATIMLAICDEAAHGVYMDHYHCKEDYSSPLRQRFKSLFGKTASYSALQTHCPDAQHWK
ncbi:MAG: hypothetical protein JO154_01235 [Chitinophaga sp.]|uniref:hypothetical protein n=1 Tax=Chitinophaga sp. TaxID=1869181 RepID=UPI0025BE0830|nr:hypothetical protein [Chitinophaga sp.]MBV8251200.1 hypothetical protein [Chitinophaga sp.]